MEKDTEILMERMRILEETGHFLLALALGYLACYLFSKNVIIDILYLGLLAVTLMIIPPFVRYMQERA